MRGNEVFFGRDGILVGCTKSCAEKLDLPMHMQGIQVDLTGAICKGVCPKIDKERSSKSRITKKKNETKKKLTTYIKCHGLVDGSPPDIAF